MTMELKRKLKKIVNIVSIFLIVGCSYYSMAGSIPANIKNVNIPLIENDTAEFEISENLTSKIIQEIAIQNILKITDDNNSDSTILGIIQALAMALSLLIIMSKLMNIDFLYHLKLFGQIMKMKKI